MSLSDAESDFLEALGFESPGKYLKEKLAEDRERFEPKEILERRAETLRKELGDVEKTLRAFEQKRLEYFETGKPKFLLDELYEGFSELLERTSRARARHIVLDGWRDGDRRIVRMSREELALYLEKRYLAEKQERLVSETLVR